MSDVVASEVQKGSTWELSRAVGLVAREFYIDHTFATGDKIQASVLGINNLYGIWAATRLDSSGVVTRCGMDALELQVVCNTALKRLHDMAGAGDIVTEDTDHIRIGSTLSTDKGLWFILITKEA